VDPARRDARKTPKLRAHRDDPDAPVGTGRIGCSYDLPPNTTPSGKRGENPGHLQRREAGIEQLAAPGLWRAVSAAGKPHRYFFKLYALDMMLNLKPGPRRKICSRRWKARARRGAVDGDVSKEMMRET